MKRKTLIILVFLAGAAGLVGYEVYRRISTATPASGAPVQSGPGGSTSGAMPKNAGPAGGPGGGPGGQGAAVAVEAAPVEISSVRELGLFTGSLQARSRFVLAPKVAGRLDRISVDVGDRVRKGQVVAVLDDREYVQLVEQAKADREVAQANLEDTRASLENAARDLERVKTLFQGRIASQAEVDTAETQYRRAETQYRILQAQVKQKQAALETVQERLASTRLVAQWDSPGETRVIGERFVDEGALLRANDPVVSVLDIGTLSATINVTENLYARMRPGFKAQAATDALPGKTFDGAVERIAPFLNETSRQGMVRVEIPNPTGELKPGMFVRVTLEYGRRDGVPTVPPSALVKRGDREGVFLLSDDGKSVKFIPVRVGIVDSGRVEITEPAIKGSVVTLGHHLLQDGSAVSLPGARQGGGRP
jgi:RND family efflux transporter MFP subunit